MPDGFEYIVRPWQSPNAHGQTIIPAMPSRGSRQSAHLTWGGKRTMPEAKLTQLDFSTQKRKPKDEKLTEKDRDSDIVRIEQEGKPENYVDVARARKVTLALQREEAPLDELGQKQYIASGLDPRLLQYEADLVRDPETTLTARAIWEFKNQQKPGAAR